MLAAAPAVKSSRGLSHLHDTFLCPCPAGMRAAAIILATFCPLFFVTFFIAVRKQVVGLHELPELADPCAAGLAVATLCVAAWLHMVAWLHVRAGGWVALM